jgi:hypothetical protein
LPWSFIERKWSGCRKDYFYFWALQASLRLKVGKKNFNKTFQKISLRKSRRASKDPKFYADFTKSGEKAPTQFCPVCPHATINTSVKLANRRVLRK